MAQIKQKLQSIVTYGLLIFFVALIVRVWGIGADLPNLYNPDEPHHLNIAAHFGTGDLNPHDFKYPTLWSYVIGAIFAFLFGFGRFLGLVESPGRFAQAYFYSPAVFYIAVRLFCATAVSSAAWIMYRTGARFYGRLLGVILGLFTALGPVFVTAGREATPYGLMIFWLALAVYQYHSLCENHNRCAWALTGLFIGLAVSTHYIAAPLAVWLVARFFIEPPADKKTGFFIFGFLFLVLGFFLGSPYALLDWPTFLRHIQAMKAASPEGAASWGLGVLLFNNVIFIGKSFFRFLDPWGFGAALALIGILTAPKKERIAYLIMMAPAVVSLPILLTTRTGNLTRHMLGIFFPLTIMAAGGFVNLARLMGAGRRLKIGLGLLVFLPSVMSIASEAYFSFSADTRDMARRWMEKTALPGEKIFVTDPYDCPQLKMSRGQIERLLKRTEALGHPRKEYYRILLEGHPGGGYEIFYLRRSFTEAGDLKERVEKSYQAQDWIDVKGEGLDVLRNQGIKYAVVCGAAAQRYGQDKWFEEMKRSCPLSAGFSPLDKKIKGPSIEIYQVGGR